ncbi:MAG: polysaccharide biosynthesis tyrosine autokinase [Acaryochloridaceae cyanobacterium SU_2_1]|nr:polysaccharide biosynthesis tyrosine autokinase [Acaryochloridaceae cyanobacterium SU_2_1]
MTKTKLIRVGFEDEDTEKILFVLKQLSDGYLKYSLEDRKTRLGSGVAFIEQQLPEIRQRVSTIESQLQSLQQKHRISDLTTEGVELAKQSRELEGQRSETQRNLRAEKDKFISLQKQLGLSPNQVIAASSLSENPRYQQLLTQLKQVETQLAQERSRFTEANPIVQDLREQQRNLAALLNQETNKIVSQSPGSGPSAAQLPKFQTSIQRNLSQQMIDSLNEIQVLEVRSQAAVEAATKIDEQLRQFPAIKRSYEQLERQLEIDTTTLNQLLLKRESLRVEAAQREIPWQLVSGPQLRVDEKGRLVLPEQSRSKKIALGILGGFLLGLGAALLKEKQQDIFHGEEDIQDQTKLALLGTIPYNSALVVEEGNFLGNERPMESEQNAGFLQACEALYTKIRFLTNPTINALVISSVSAQDGKTTIALYLAQAAARMGQRVLLVDANLPFPQLHVCLGLPNVEGLSEILSQNLDPNQLIQRVPYQTNLSILTAGQTEPSTNKVLASNQMKYLMEQLQNMFDLVIYDTPHLQSHADANFLSVNTDGMLVIVGMGKTRQSEFSKTLTNVQAARIPILGFVSNFSGSTMRRGSEAEGLENDFFDEEELEDEFEIFRVGSRN